MATSVENKICKNCGTEIRLNAMFCYHCGGSVAPEVEKSVSDAWFRENINEGKNGDNSAPVAVTADKPIPKPTLVEEPKLKSAASMRRKSKNPTPKRVEIIWEEHQNAPNGWFILAAILLTSLAAGILYLALRLR